MSADILLLPWVERRDLGGARPDHDVLAGAIAEGVSGIVVVGRDRRGELYIASSTGDADKVIGQLMQAVQYLASAVMLPQAPDDAGEEGA